MTDKLIMTTAQRDALLVSLCMATPKTNSALDILVGGRLVAEADMLQSLPVVTDEPIIYQWKSPFTAGKWVESSKADCELIETTDAYTQEPRIAYTRRLYASPPSSSQT